MSGSRPSSRPARHVLEDQQRRLLAVGMNNGRHRDTGRPGGGQDVQFGRGTARPGIGLHDDRAAVRPDRDEDAPLGHRHQHLADGHLMPPGPLQPPRRAPDQCQAVSFLRLPGHLPILGQPGEREQPDPAPVLTATALGQGGRARPVDASGLA
jgi:hypothetical protein